MKKLLTTLTVLAAIIIPSSPALFLGGQAGAANVFPGICGPGNDGASVSGTPTVCKDVRSQDGDNGSNDPIVKIIKAAIDVLSIIIGAAAIIGILASALRMTTSGGDSNAIAGARTTLVYCLVGVAVAALAQAIVVFVLDKL